MNEKLSVFETVFGAPLDCEAPVRQLLELTTQRAWTAKEAQAEVHRLGEVHDAHEQNGRLPAEEQACLTVSDTDAERFCTYNLLSQLCMDQRLWCSTFFDWPVYERLFQEQGHTVEQGGRALMLGSQEPLASLAFAALAKEVYGVEQAYIIDIVSGDDKRRHGNFIYGDALRMPFADGSFDIVQTSQLFPSIRDSQGQFSQPEKMMAQVFEEAHRVLKSGGQLLMRELLWASKDVLELGSTPAQVSESMALVKGMCTAAGFARTRIRPLIVPASLRGLFDPNQNFWFDGFEFRPDCYTIYASR